MEERPDPNKILAEHFPRQNSDGKGKLKIFFGYAAGVGKTYAMLEAARDDLNAGVDVAAGYIEPNGWAGASYTPVSGVQRNPAQGI